jgi:hypothetical protein
MKPKDPLTGWFKGSVQIAPGTDLTLPAHPYWGLDLEEFISRCADTEPPRGVEPVLEALWWTRKGNWERAHEIIMAHEGEPDADWVHAYLHRLEGDIPNAHYWYRRAKKAPATGSLDIEWQQILDVVLEAAIDRFHRSMKTS